MKLEDQIYELMKKFAVEPAGKLLIHFRGKVENVGKQSDVKNPSSTAKTEIDEIIQNLFLEELHTIAPSVRVNAEETTSVKHLFAGSVEPGLTIHHDPCDGTLSYVHGSERFTTGYAISDENNNFTHTVIYVPAKKTLYFASPQEVGICKFVGRRPVILPLHEGFSKRIYNKRLLSEEGIARAEEAGFYVEDVHCSHLCIIETALGLAGAFLYGGSYPHDSMVPYAFAKKCGAGLVDRTGKPIKSSNLRVALVNAKGESMQQEAIEQNKENCFIKFERIPSVFYFSHWFWGRNVNALLGILSNERNLDMEYLTRYQKFEMSS